MPTLTIRNIPDGLVRQIKLSAARNGRSMEEEVRSLLRERFESRERVLARVRERWKLMRPTPAAEVERWIAQMRGRNDGL